jgi:amino acid adenylation domain-containing protein
LHPDETGVYGTVVNIIPFNYNLRFAGHPAREHILSTGPVDDLTITVYDILAGCDVRVMFRANPAHYTAEELAAHQRRFVALLGQLAVAMPDEPLHRLDMLSAEERQTLLEGFNATARPVPESTLAELFEEQVERAPEALALVFGEQELSYKGLNERANRLAHHLIELGVGPETLVGIALERSVEMVVALLGILKAGGAYLPVLVISSAALRRRLPETVAVMSVDEPEVQAALDAAPRHDPSDVERRGSLLPHHPAYVIYTSGSTGRPKGVVIPHSAICNHMLWMQERFPLSPADRVLQKTPFSFDASVWEFYAPLLVGAQLVVARPGPAGHQDGQYLCRVMAQHQVTTLQLVPSMLRMMLDEGGLETCDSLRRLFCGGEALAEEVKERFVRSTSAELINLYGPTEATIDASYWVCDGKEGGRRVSLGRPVANTQVYVLNCYLLPVPVGVPGELHIGGAGLARGYLNRSALTAEKFIPNPFSATPGDRLYRTGDLVRYLPDGNIEFLGRNDHQVKLRGYRIELKEIEAALSAHPTVQDCVMMAREDGANQKRLVAYVVWRGELAGAAPLTAELRRFLRKKLPEFMMPSTFVSLGAMPLTPNGKLD